MSERIRSYSSGGAITDSKSSYQPTANPIGGGLPLSRFSNFRESVDAATQDVCAGCSGRAINLFRELRAETLKLPAGELIGPLRLRRVETLYSLLFEGGK